MKKIHHWSLKRRLQAICSLILFLLWAVLVTDSLRIYDDIKHSAQQEQSRLSLLLSKHIQLYVEDVRIALGRLEILSLMDLPELFNEKTMGASLPAVMENDINLVQVAIFDEKGQGVFGLSRKTDMSRHPLREGFKIPAHDYQKIQTGHHDALDMIIGRPFQTDYSGQELVPFYRLIEDFDGFSKAIVMAAFSLDKVSDLFNTINNNSNASLFLKDGTILLSKYGKESLDETALSKIQNAFEGKNDIFLHNDKNYIFHVILFSNDKLSLVLDMNESLIKKQWWEFVWVRVLEFLIVSILIVILMQMFLRHHKSLERTEKEKIACEKTALQAHFIKNSFLSNMNHELRTPLNAIIGFVEVLRMEIFGKLNKKQSQYLEDVDKSSRYLLSMIEDVLDVGAVADKDFILEETHFDPVDLLQDELNKKMIIASKNGITLSYTGPAVGQLSLWADKRAVQNVIAHLLVKTLNATTKNGQLEIMAVVERTGLRLEVTNVGQGMSMYTEDLLLEPFAQFNSCPYTRTHQSIDIGVSVMRSLMDVHGGEMGLSHSKDGGLTMYVCFPPQRLIANDSLEQKPITLDLSDPVRFMEKNES